MNYPTWTKDRVTVLAKMWREGVSASKIAAHLGGVTRNAVIGKAHRVGLAGRATTSRMKSHYSRRRRAAPTAPRAPARVRIPSFPTAPLPEIPVSDIARVSLADAERHHCRFIPGDARGVPAHAPLFCGQTAVTGTSWCPGHLKRISQAPEPARKRQEFALSAIVKGRTLEHA